MKRLFRLLPLLLLLSACQLPFAGSNSITVTINVDGNSQSMQGPEGISVQQILDTAGITLQPLDRVDPSLTSVITRDTTVTITRVSEEFVVQQSVLPFETQTVKNESIPEGQKILIQPGVNGQVATTYRVVKENGKEVSRSAVKTETIVDAKPEILMIGVQSPFVPQPIVGRLAYITASNAWLMEGSTGNRRPLVTTGDLDGRIFVISPDRNWLLFHAFRPPHQVRHPLIPFGS